MFAVALDQFLPWIFSLNHTHCYARWLPVYIQTLKKLPDQHREIYEEFKKGRFTFQKQRHFSLISDDQAHEQNNKVNKGSGGAVGIFDSRISLAKWMIAGPEIVRMLSSFDETVNDYGERTELYSHHQNTTSFENMFKKDFKNLKYEFKKVGNTFLKTLKYYTH